MERERSASTSGRFESCAAGRRGGCRLRYTGRPIPRDPRTGPKDYQRTTLAARHRPIVRALAEAFFSPDGELSPERLDALVDEVDRFVSPASKTLRFGLKLMLFVLNVSPMFFLRFRTFASLPVGERIHHLERLESSKLSQLPLLVVSYKTLMTMLFYEDEAELQAVGYDEERARWRKAKALPVVSRAEAGS